MIDEVANLTLLYESKNISKDIYDEYLSFLYIDRLEFASDEIVIKLANNTWKWFDSWYPGKKAKLTASLSYKGKKLKCGSYEIDKISFEGAPDTITISAIASGITKKLRTRKTRFFENKTLESIVSGIAASYGLKLVGRFDSLLLEGEAQARETDLAFLRRLAVTYGYYFSIKGNNLVFVKISSLLSGKPVATINRKAILSYVIEDKSIDIYKTVKVSSSAPVGSSSGQNKVSTRNILSMQNKDNIPYDLIDTTKPSEDELLLNPNVPSFAQGEAIAESYAYKIMSKQIEASIEVEGNPLLVAGAVFSLSEHGKLNGKYLIIESRHTVSRSAGYKTAITFYRITEQNLPKFANRGEVSKAGTPNMTEIRQNADNIPYELIKK